MSEHCERAGEPSGELERVNQELKEMFTMFIFVGN
jgi:hypothetical protein